MVAASHGHTSAVKMLDELGTDVNSRVTSTLGNQTAVTAIMFAAAHAHTTTVKAMHELGADLNARTSDKSCNQRAVV